MDKRDLIAELRTLLGRIDALAMQLQRSQEENRSLRQQYEQMAGERAQLLAKQEQARTRVEAMIGRLKSLEQHTRAPPRQARATPPPPASSRARTRPVATKPSVPA